MYMKAERRKYELKKRADRQDETRQRIIEAAVALHEQLGPAQTSISAIAERAEVGRPTVYRHFPDERSLFTACSSHYLRNHVFPDSMVWRQIDDPEERLRFGLLEIYRWYRDTEQMMHVVYRDLSEIPVLKEVMEPVFDQLSKAVSVLSAGWTMSEPDLLQAAIGHALAFSTWRSLARVHGLRDETIADLMTAMVGSSARTVTAIS